MNRFVHKKWRSFYVLSPLPSSLFLSTILALKLWMVFVFIATIVRITQVRKEKKTCKKEEEDLGKKFVIFTVVSLLAFVHYFVEIVHFFLLSIGLVFFCLLGKSFCLWALTPLPLHWSFNVAENLAKKTHIHTRTKRFALLFCAQ